MVILTQRGMADLVSEPTGVEDCVGLLSSRLRSRRWRFVKRACDLPIAVPMAVLTLPLQAALGALIKCSSRGPIFFVQHRIGRDGHPIDVVKFRTMVVDAEGRLRADRKLMQQYEANGYKIPAGKDPRITPLGRVLRKYSLDELPQLWCIVVGSMSLVGPRPIVPPELERLYGNKRQYYLAVKPGLTGRWQVSGRCNLSPATRAELDTEYVREWSIGRDLLILVRTVPAVVLAHGAH